MAISSYRLNASSYASATGFSSTDSEMAQHSRNYPYSSAGYDNSPSPPADYPQSYAQPSARAYYAPTPGGQYYPIAPAPPSSDRYSSSSYRPSGGSPEYSSSSAYSSPYNNASTAPYPYAAPAPRAHNPDAYRPAASPPPRSFIPTPSEAYAHRPPRPSSAMQHTHASRSYLPSAVPVRASHQSSSRAKSSSGMSPTSPSATSTERFVCDVCNKDFSRAHDRKRHYETQHTTSPTPHKCRWCEKDFSRADSLKRHMQNGCDEAPQGQ